MTDPRVLGGLETQLGDWRKRLAAGERRLGWKIGLNLPAVQQQLGIDAPVIGSLTDATLLEDGATFRASGASALFVEPEVAIQLTRDVESGVTDQRIRQAIGALAPAIEIVDVDLPFEDVERIVAENIFHRGVVLGSADQEQARGVLDGLAVRVRRDGVSEAEIPDASAAGDLAATVRLVAELLGDCGERLKTGDVIIAGSLTPPVPVQPGDSVRVDSGALGELQVGFID